MRPLDAAPLFSHAGSQADPHLMAEIIEGLSHPQKRLPPKLFYDERGSSLFERICRQPEYYIPSVETALLKRHAAELAAFCGSRSLVIEPGAGSGEKTSILLGALEAPQAYIPVEISDSALQHCLANLRGKLPNLPIHPLRADFTQAFSLPPSTSGWGRRMIFLPGSTIGNFEPPMAARLLAHWQMLAGPRGVLIVGVDLRKPRAVFECAYDDAAGVTAAFNLNMLEHLNREYGSNFDLKNFRHLALYNEELSRVEMHLVSQRPQRVRIGNRSFLFEAGERLHTENSYKYCPADFAELALSAGWARRGLWIDDDDLFSLQCFEAIA